MLAHARFYHVVAVASLVTLAAGTARAAPRVIVIGVDGASWNLVGPFAERGVTPTLGALAAEGARGELASFWPLRTPQVWTSIVTGKLPGQHGIWDHVSNSIYNPPGFRTQVARPVTSAERRSKALWQILSDAGSTSLVVGWVASWPAERVEHAVIVAPAMSAPGKRQASIKGTLWRNASGEVAPGSLWPGVRELIVEPREVSARALRRFADLPPAGSRLLRLPFIESYVYALRWSLARAESVEAITVALAERQQPELLLAYFQCTDTLLHRFWIFQQPLSEIRARLEGHGIPSGPARQLGRRFGRVVEACYRDVDERVGRILAATRGAETLVLVVSDHGFGPAPKPHTADDEPYGGNHREDGLIIAAGPGVSPGTTIQGASVLDLTPTILHRFGLPVGADMRGKVIPELFGGNAALAREPPRSIPSYEAKPQTEVPFAEGWPARKARPIATDR